MPFTDEHLAIMRTKLGLAADADEEKIVATVAEVMEEFVKGPDVPAPRLTFQEIGSRHAVTAEAIALLVNSGVLLREPALERYIRETYGIPDKEPLPGQEPPAQSTTVPAPSGTGEGADS